MSEEIRFSSRKVKTWMKPWLKRLYRICREVQEPQQRHLAFRQYRRDRETMLTDRQRWELDDALATLEETRRRRRTRRIV